MEEPTPLPSSLERQLQQNIYATDLGTIYLKDPQALLLSSPAVDLAPVFEEFLPGFSEDLEFSSYAEDEWLEHMMPGEALAKFAGQLCYMSFGPKRTWNKDASRYFLNILDSGHGSLFYHINYSILLFGIDRAVTHEIVRHQAGFGFSQVSQRYVHGSNLRFVMRPEYQGDPTLEMMFRTWIDTAASEYERRAAVLAAKIKPTFGGSASELRKKVNQAARACLPNETEAPILITANARAWRHFMAMRGSQHADSPIRGVALKIADILSAELPLILQDLEIKEVEGYGRCIQLAHPKV